VPAPIRDNPCDSVPMWSQAGDIHRRHDTRLGFAFPMGIALIAAGRTLGSACIATFVSRGEGTPAPMDPPRKFVAAGPYRFARNSVYGDRSYRPKPASTRNHRYYALRSAMASTRAFLCHLLRRAASPRHIWLPVRRLLPLGAAVAASTLVVLAIFR
jgi:hypothetical protein